jgi:hypothetical protein
MSALAFLLTLRALLRNPYREQRIAALSGVVVSIGFWQGRRLAFDPDWWTMPLNPGLMRAATFILCTLTLMLVAVAYRSLRRRSRHPLLLGVVGAVPGVLLVCAMVLADAQLQGRELGVALEELPYDATLAIGAFLAPLITFELLRRTELWAERPSEPPV